MNSIFIINDCVIYYANALGRRRRRPHHGSHHAAARWECWIFSVCRPTLLHWKTSGGSFGYPHRQSLRRCFVYAQEQTNLLLNIFSQLGHFLKIHCNGRLLHPIRRTAATALGQLRSTVKICQMCCYECWMQNDASLDRKWFELWCQSTCNPRKGWKNGFKSDSFTTQCGYATQAIFRSDF